MRFRDFQADGDRFSEHGLPQRHTQKVESSREVATLVPDALLGLFPVNVFVHALKGKL